MYGVVMQPVVLQMVVGTAGDSAGPGSGCILGLQVDPVRVMLVLVVSTVRLLEALHWVMVPLVRLMVSANVAMGGDGGGDGAAGDVTGECAAGESDGEGAVGEGIGWWRWGRYIIEVGGGYGEGAVGVASAVGATGDSNGQGATGVARTRGRCRRWCPW